MPYLAAVLAGIPVFSWVTLPLFAGLSAVSLLAAATLGLKDYKFAAIGVVLLAGILSVGAGLVAAVFTGRWVRARLVRGSLLIAALWILFLFAFLSFAPAPFIYVLQ
jgi:hypothetical protein